jgi:hypothetical protein
MFNRSLPIRQGPPVKEGVVRGRCGRFRSKCYCISFCLTARGVDQASAVQLLVEIRVEIWSKCNVVSLLMVQTRTRCGASTRTPAARRRSPNVVAPCVGEARSYRGYAGCYFSRYVWMAASRIRGRRHPRAASAPAPHHHQLATRAAVGVSEQGCGLGERAGRGKHLRIIGGVGWTRVVPLGCCGVHLLPPVRQVSAASRCSRRRHHRGAWSRTKLVESTKASKLRERAVNYDTLSPSCKPHSTNTGLGPRTVLN